jgi:exodeoxyribonuclease VII large subunit
LRLQNLNQQLHRAGRHLLDSRREKLLPLIRTLNAVSPLATLERGYAIVSIQGGEILRDAAHVRPGAIIEARLAQGRLRAKVEGTS